MRNPLNKRYKRAVKNDFAKYFVIFALLALMISAVSGFEATNYSIVKTIKKNEVKLNLQSGLFTTKKKLNNAQIRLIEENNLKVYEEFYIDEELEDETTLRFYALRNTVDLQLVFDGRLPTSSNEIAVERLYAENHHIQIGDCINYKNLSFTVVGTVSLVDYSALFASNNQMMMNAISFGIGMLTSDGFNQLNRDEITYRYAYKYNEDYDEATLREKNDELKDVLVENTQIKEFIPSYENKAITYVLDDAEGDSAGMYIFLYLMLILIAYISSITIANTIVKEATVIGTLKASGYSYHELIRHYILMPFIISIIGMIVGNILGYTAVESYMITIYFASFSLAKYVPYFNLNCFIYTSIVPVLMMLVINCLVLSKTLKLKPLKFMRRDLNKHLHRRALKLNHKIPFFTRFRTRIILQNKNAYITLVIGILIANLLFFFGMGLPDVLNHYIDVSKDGMIAPYETVLNMPLSLSASDHKLEASINLLDFASKVKTDNETAEKFSFISLKISKGEIYKEDDVNCFGLVLDSQYFPYDLKSDDCYISKALATKYELEVGDYFKVYKAYENDEYVFKVTGITENNASLEFYLNIDTLNDIFELGEGMYVGYFSKTPITDIDNEYISQVITAETTASLSTQLLSSLGSMMDLYSYFAIIVFFLVIFILSKMIIERNALSISMSKILGYSNIEIARLYIISTTLVVIFAALISILICYGPLVKAFEQIFYIEMAGWIPLIVQKKIGVYMFISNVLVYAFVALFEFRRISKVRKDEALKNVE